MGRGRSEREAWRALAAAVWRLAVIDWAGEAPDPELRASRAERVAAGAFLRAEGRDIRVALGASAGQADRELGRLGLI